LLHRFLVAMVAAKVPVRAAEDIRADHSKGSRCMINCEQFSDFTFVVEGRPVYSHKATLAAHSERLKAQLSGAFSDSSGPLVIEDIGHNAFANVVLEWIYTGCFREPEGSDAIGILKLAEVWQLEDLLALTASHLSTLVASSGDLCLRALNMAFKRCELDFVCRLEDSSPKLWSSLFDICLSQFRDHYLDFLNTDASVVMHIESYELMHMVLSCIDFQKLPAATIMQLGQVFMFWLKGGEAPEDFDTHDMLFDVFDHVQSLVGPESLDGSGSFRVPAHNIKASKVWADDSCSVVMDNWTMGIHLGRKDDYLRCYVSQKVSCDFLNKWPWSTQVSLSLACGTAKKDNSLSMTQAFGKIFRNSNTKWGFPKFLEWCDLPHFIVDGHITLNVKCSVLPSPVVKLCLMYASLSFQQLRQHPRLPCMEESVLRHLLCCGCLDAKCESEVVEVLVAWSRCHQCLSRELVGDIRLEYATLEDLQRLQEAASLCSSAALEEAVLECLSRQSSPQPRASYSAHEVRLTLANLVRGALANQGGHRVAAEEREPFTQMVAARGPCRCSETLPSGESKVASDTDLPATAAGSDVESPATPRWPAEAAASDADPPATPQSLAEAEVFPSAF